MGASVGCSESYRAELHDGAGLAAQSPVMSSGVVVGEAESVQVVDDVVRIEFVVHDDHDLELHADACVLAGRYEDTPSLYILGGTDGEWDDGEPLRACRLRLEEARSLAHRFGEAMGEMLRGMHEGFFEEGWPGWPVPDDSGETTTAPIPVTPVEPAPSTPEPPSPTPRPRTNPVAPTPTPASTVCDAMGVRVTAIEELNSEMLHLPRGGFRVRMTFVNDGDVTAELPARSQAVFFDRARARLRPATLPASSDWWMPLTIPAHGSATTSVTFHAGDSEFSVGGFRVSGVHPASSPFDRCALSVTIGR